MDRFGHYVLSSQVYTNARDLGRFGLLYLNRGKWNGEQVLPETWVDFVRTPAPATRGRGQEYGGHWWLVPDSRADLPQDAYSTNGARGQYTVVVPSYDLVVVRRGLDFRTGGRGLSQWDLLAEIIKAFPGRKGGAKLTGPTS
jgi:CubicO group peptidase (beta-lactamase class C family)